jgi:glycosyltransferase involved in cell wall biosynthesis
VVLPVGNAVRTLSRAVESMRAQTFAGWEMIAVDDGSTDGSREMLEGLARSDARIRVVAQPHGGIVAALNTGLAAVRGGLIARMDADDEAHPERLAEQVDFLERNPAVGLVGCLVEYGGDRRANAGYALHVDWINSLVSPEQIALNCSFRLGAMHRKSAGSCFPRWWPVRRHPDKAARRGPRRRLPGWRDG